MTSRQDAVDGVGIHVSVGPMLTPQNAVAMSILMRCQPAVAKVTGRRWIATVLRGISGIDRQLSALLDPSTPDAMDRMKVATAQRRVDALDKEAEAARATARRIENEALEAKTAAAEALRRLEASQVASRDADAAASRARLIVTLSEAKKMFDSPGASDGEH
jgi:hypothetical protein